jgi:hypothetical protein
MHFFLNVKRRRVDYEFAPIFFILAAPNELRIKVAVAAFVGDAQRALVGLPHDGLIFRRRNIFPLGLVVL